MAFRLQYISSTTNIFYYDNNYAFRLRAMTLRPDAPSNFTIPNHATQRRLPTIFSSCQGLIACRSTTTGFYFVGNPYLIDIPVHLRYAGIVNPPTFHHPAITHVVLAVDPSSVPPLFLLICAAQRADNGYNVDAFNSHDQVWHSFKSEADELYHGAIVPNSGVGFGRQAFWLLGRRSVLSFYIGQEGDDEPGRVTIFNILRPFPSGRARMQLGRVYGRPGLVIVNAAAQSTVELLILQPDMNNPWQRVELFNVLVVVDGDIARWRQEDMTLVCRTMPRPMRFNSSNVELLFWVQGRVIRLENTGYGSRQYWLTVFPDGDLPAAIIDGVPHICSGYRPMGFVDHRRVRNS